MNFKNFFAFLIVALATITMASASQKIAIIDMETVIRSHPKAEQNDKALRAKQAELETKRDALLAELKAKEEKIVQLEKDIRSNPMYSDKMKAEKAEEGRALIRDFQEAEKTIRGKVAEMQRELSREERKLFAEVMDDVKDAVKRVAEVNEFTHVLDSSAYRTGAPIPIVVYSAPNTDITDAVITTLGGKRREIKAAE